MPTTRRNLLQRIAAAALLLPPVLWLVWRGSWPAAALFSVAALLAAAEFYRLTFDRLRAEVLPGLVAAAALPLLPMIAPRMAAGLLVACLAATSIASWSWHVLRAEIEPAPRHASEVVEGVVFCALGPFSLSMLRLEPDGATWVLAVLACTWSNDAAAFAAGSLWGRHKLAPRVSPGKTWEGVAGGALGAAAAAVAARLTFAPSLTWWDAAVVTAVTSTLGPMGDLMKSVLKRSAQVKDAGHLIPGHGGMLDRIDALLVNAPAVLAYVIWSR